MSSAAQFRFCPVNVNTVQNTFHHLLQSQRQMLEAPRLSGTSGPTSISDLFSRSKRITATLINQLAPLLEITILRS